jgi:hypothetical protein
MSDKWKSAIKNDGYYVGNVYELFDDISFFDECIEGINSALGNKEFHGYRSTIVNRPDLKMQIPCTEIENRKNTVEREDLLVYQQWHEITGWVGDQKNGNLHKGIKKFIQVAYPTTSENNLGFYDSWSLYENDDFIQLHTDGDNIGRLCVFLIYLSPAETYNNGGGRLIVQDKKNKIRIVDPVRENFVVLDFSKTNLSHAVEVVKNDFKRYSFISFIYDNALVYRHNRLAKLKEVHKKLKNIEEDQ